ncbi:EFR1 family ferrodoxin [Sulfurospirillum arcachonense]|uniref:EFR1 family ferrodoxin n=1 Tax=Sulfurospirillum arcachonense TaxID=57666 RepID=UPI00046941AF|nr:EFR1 family ferrodoxin [Sulfurospirillum arcachonense]
MKISIFYYSGAGNTKFVAKKITNSFKKTHNVVSTKIKSNLLESTVDDDFDVLGIGFPIYFRNAPELVGEFLKTLDGKSRKVFFFCTKGLYSGNAIKKIMELSIKQNFIPSRYIEFYMPGTDALLLLAKKGSLLEKFFKSIYSRNIEVKIEKFTSNIVNSNTNIPNKKWYTFLDNLIVKNFEKKWTDQNKKLIPQFYSKKDICIGCMKCVKDCPRNNIFYDQHIQFGLNCDTCFYCIHNCPVEAIQIGDITENTVRYNKVTITT